MSWARLLKRVFDIDIERCPYCGGTLKIIAAIVDPSVIAKILAHLGLPTRTPPRAPARSFDFFVTAWSHTDTQINPVQLANRQSPLAVPRLTP